MMSLSKVRNRLRMKKERARVRVQKALSAPRTSKPVQPKPLLDASGEVIPDYG